MIRKRLHDLREVHEVGCLHKDGIPLPDIGRQFRKNLGHSLMIMDAAGRIDCRRSRIFLCKLE